MILVVGATGYVGGEICRLLAQAERPLRALVRPTSERARVESLSRLSVPLHPGDLKERASLDAACRGARVVVSTVSSTLSRQAGDSIDTVDLRGQLALVDAAAAAGVEHFVFVSFAPVPVSFALQDAKRAVEDRLAASGMAYTVLQPVDFMEVWLSPVLGFDPAAARARILGRGDRPVSWISLGDVARFAVAAASQPAAKAAQGVFPLGGPEDLSPLEVVRIFEEVSGRSFTLEHVPEEALEAQYRAAGDPIQQAFAALMLGTARGYVVDSRAALAAMPLERTSVRDYARRLFPAS